MSQNLPVLEHMIIHHAAFARAHQRLERCFMQAGQSIAIYGEGGVGKTSLLRSFAAEHKPAQSQSTEFPVLLISVPSRPTIKSLAETILWALDERVVARLSESRIHAKLVGAMRHAGTQLLLIDEFQHCGGCANQKLVTEIAEWLIALTSGTGTRLVVSGCPSYSDFFVRNPRFARRFGEPMTMVRFSWNEDASRQDFIGFLKSMQFQLAKRCDVSILDSPGMHYLMYCASGGLIGNLVRLLKHAVHNAMLDSRSAICIDDLAVDHS
jgi:GTPase SAR1 family protein